MKNNQCKQPVFSSTYVRRLYQTVTIDKYSSDTFLYDEKYVLYKQDVNQPVGLSNKMSPSSDIASAIALYEAYSQLELLQAADVQFWVYLAHADLYHYMKSRWDSIWKGSEGKIVDSIRSHWFIKTVSQSSLMRHGLSRLWWAVHLSIDDDNMNDKYELTRVMFRHQDVAFRTLGTYKLGRCKEAVLGVLSFVKQNEDLFEKYYEPKMRYLSKYLNVVGGTKALVFLDRNEIKNELLPIRSKIAKVVK